MSHWFVRLVRDEDGQDLIEYAFLAVFIAVAVTAALTGVRNALSTQFSNISTQVGGGL